MLKKLEVDNFKSSIQFQIREKSSCFLKKYVRGGESAFSRKTASAFE